MTSINVKNPDVWSFLGVLAWGFVVRIGWDLAGWLLYRVAHIR